MAYTNAVMNTPSFLATPPSCAEKMPRSTDVVRIGCGLNRGI